VIDEFIDALNDVMRLIREERAGPSTLRVVHKTIHLLANLNALHHPERDVEQQITYCMDCHQEWPCRTSALLNPKGMP
jgi:hypothetical protein